MPGGVVVSVRTAETAQPLLPLRARTSLMLALVSAVGVAAFSWPFFVQPGTALDNSHGADAPWFFVVLLPLLAAVVLAEISSGGIDAKTIAMLGMLVAVAAALRALGPGAAGIEPGFVVILLGGRVFGRGFGFVLGALAIFAGALITGGVGPWMPFQMFGAAWVGLFAGMLPGARGRAEVVILAAYGVVAGLFYGALLNLWFWPFAADGTQLDYVAGGPIAENVHRYAVFWATTSLGWDVPRGVLTAAVILAAGSPVLRALRRTARRGNFG